MSVKVCLTEGRSLWVGGELRTEGDQVCLEEAVAEEWERAGYVVPAKPGPTRTRGTATTGTTP